MGQAGCDRGADAERLNLPRLSPSQYLPLQFLWLLSSQRNFLEIAAFLRMYKMRKLLYSKIEIFYRYIQTIT